MAKASCVLVLLLIINFSNIFVIGKSAVGGSKNDEENAINAFSGSVNSLEKYYSHALAALAEDIKSEFQNLKAQVARLEDRVERHDTFMNDSMEEIKRQLQTEGVEKKKEFQVKGQDLPRGECPPGFNNGVSGFPKCYAALNETINWNRAQERCRELHSNAHLAVIMNSREEQTITGILQNRNCPRTDNRFPDNRLERVNSFWIGARRKNISDCNSTFEWISNNGTTFPIQYSNWNPGEPSCAKQSEACASLNKYTALKWNDLMCTWTACPLCEVTINV